MMIDGSLLTIGFVAGLFAEWCIWLIVIKVANRRGW